MKKLLLSEDWKEFLKENGDYELLSEFKNSKEKFLIRHNCEHSNEYNVFPYVFKRGGGRCTFCNEKSFKKTTESVTVEFARKNFKLLEEYIDTHSNLNFLCQKCGQIQNNSRNNVIKENYNCPSCKNSRKRKYYDATSFRNFLLKERKGEYELIGEFKPFPDKIFIKHLVCGDIWELPYRSMIDMRNCPKCVKKANEIKSRRTIDELKMIVEKDNTFLLITEEWVETHSEIKIKHIECGRIFKTTPNRFIHEHSRCYHCRLENTLSHNAKRLYDKLKQLNIEFETEFKIKECFHIYSLPFDFAIIHNSKTILIEYDGKQHFKPSFFTENDKESFERAKLNFELTQKRDSIKNKFAEDNKERYQLIRLNGKNINDFLEFDIYNLLNITTSETIRKE